MKSQFPCQKENKTFKPVWNINLKANTESAIVLGGKKAKTHLGQVKTKCILKRYKGCISYRPSTVTQVRGLNVIPIPAIVSALHSGLDFADRFLQRNSC